MPSATPSATPSPTPLSGLGDRVWLDVNHDGKQDLGEPGVPNVLATLYLNGVPVSTTLTNDVGYYQFIELTSGVPYSVSFQLPNGYEWTLRDIGDDAEDSDVDSGGSTPVVTLPPSTFNPTLDAGIWTQPTAAITKTSLSPGATSAGEVITYQIVVRNTGVTLAQTVVITDPIPQSTTYVADSASPSAPLVNGNLVWPAFSLAPGAAFTVTFAVLVDAQLGGATVITNVAQTRFDGYPIVLSSNRVVHPLGPTAITLDAFSAEMGQGGVRVQWRTSLERNALGFNLLHSNTGDRASATRVNAALISALGPQGGTYELLDANGIPGSFYWIEETELSGATRVYGPAQVASLSGVMAPNDTMPRLGGQAIVANPGAPLAIAIGAAPVSSVSGQSVMAGSSTAVKQALPGVAPAPAALTVLKSEPADLPSTAGATEAAQPRAVSLPQESVALQEPAALPSMPATQTQAQPSVPSDVASPEKHVSGLVPVAQSQKTGVIFGADEPSPVVLRSAPKHTKVDPVGVATSVSLPVIVLSILGIVFVFGVTGTLARRRIRK